MACVGAGIAAGVATAVAGGVAAEMAVALETRLSSAAGRLEAAKMGGLVRAGSTGVAEVPLRDRNTSDTLFATYGANSAMPL